jgi:hypothetical protein
MSEHKVRYYYFGRQKGGRHGGIISMAVQVAPDYSAVEFAMSFCSPKDQFSKVRGRNIAHGRLDCSREAEHTDLQPQFKQMEAEYAAMLQNMLANPAEFSLGNGQSKLHALMERMSEVYQRMNAPCMRYKVPMADTETPSEAICRFFNTDIPRSSLPQWCRGWQLKPDNLGVGSPVEGSLLDAQRITEQQLDMALNTIAAYGKQRYGILLEADLKLPVPEVRPNLPEVEETPAGANMPAAT